MLKSLLLHNTTNLDFFSVFEAPSLRLFSFFVVAIAINEEEEGEEGKRKPQGDSEACQHRPFPDTIKLR